jgi:hypothetical protein
VGILNNTFKLTLVQKFSRICIHIALALPILLHGSQIWALRKKDKKRLTSIKVQFFRRTCGYTLLDHTRNEETLEGLKAEPVETKKIQIKLATSGNENKQQ